MKFKLFSALGSALALVAMAAPAAHAQTPAAVAASPGLVCVERTIYPSNSYQQCAYYMQVLLNDQWYARRFDPIAICTNQLLTTDGYYGPHTESDVAYFNWCTGNSGGDVMTQPTWQTLCFADWADGYTGVYWHDAGCLPGTQTP